MVVVSTASPYKFNGSVLEALQVETDGLDEFGLLGKLREMNDQPIPAGLAALKTKEVRHKGVCGKEAMAESVLNFIET